VVAEERRGLGRDPAAAEWLSCADFKSCIHFEIAIVVLMANLNDFWFGTLAFAAGDIGVFERSYGILPCQAL